jgi:hypothetical protein
MGAIAEPANPERVLKCQEVRARANYLFMIELVRSDPVRRLQLGLIRRIFAILEVFIMKY